MSDFVRMYLWAGVIMYIVSSVFIIIVGGLSYLWLHTLLYWFATIVIAGISQYVTGGNHDRNR